MHVIFGLAVVAGLSAAVMAAWNLVMPDIFGLTAISFWQALGLLVLSWLLFGGKHFMQRHHRHAHRNPIRERWMKMTPDEREAFIQKTHGFFHRHAFGKGGWWEESGLGGGENGSAKKENEQP
jgi:hypothetical protein